MFLCPRCGLLYEPGPNGLTAFPALSAAITTELSVPDDVRYLAVWRLRAPSWERLDRVAESGVGFLYVPAFTLVRPVLQRLGVGLCQMQPGLDLTSGLPAVSGSRPAVVGGERSADDSWPLGPGFEGISPVVVSRQDARALAEFVRLAVETHESHDLHPANDALVVESEELVFVPAAWDPRYIHESNWRLLLREFDGLVA